MEKLVPQETTLRVIASAAPRKVRVDRVRLGYGARPGDAVAPTPRLSWITVTDTAGWSQERVELEWNGEVVELTTSESVAVEWPFPPLVPHQRGVLRVRVTGTDGRSSAWSEPVEIRSAFLGDGEWQAPLIGAPEPGPAAKPVYLRREFRLDREVTRATVFSTAHGVYQVSINGVDVDDSVLKPGWTSYQERVLHDAVDVGHLLTETDNVLGVRLAGGWFTEEYGTRPGSGRRVYGDQPSAAVQLWIEFADGSAETICTDDRWRASTEIPLVSSGIYAGERVDARLAQPGWDRAGFDDSGWGPVEVTTMPVAPAVALAEPIRRTQELPVWSVLVTPSGKTVLDFGQNLVGRLRIRVAGERGQVVTLRHAEVLEGGELCTRPLRFARATDEFVLAGTGLEVFEPEFTFHGFRYVQVDGWPGDLDPSQITAVVVGSDMVRTCWFDTSDARLNRLHHNVVWSMRGNFLSIPTDCPQRDERLGWTGDLQIFAPSAASLFDCHGFVASWLKDLEVEQRELDGVCPCVVPNVLEHRHMPIAGWGDAAVIVPMVLYDRFGDTSVLADQYPSMRDWVLTLLRIAGDSQLWRSSYQLGDWLDPAAPPDDPAASRTDNDLVASAYLIRSLDLTARCAQLLGHSDDQERFSNAAVASRRAFRSQFAVSGGRRLSSDTATAYALALVFELADGAEQRAAFGSRLAALVREGGYTVPTGFLGTPVLLDALTDTGHVDVALRVLFQTKSPSWLYQVLQGATTIWERWDSLLPDGRINPGEMTSFNHYAFGAVVDWIHRTIGGIAPVAPGYRRIRIAPVTRGPLSHSWCRLDTPYGTAEVRWVRNGPETAIDMKVPANVTAEFVPPDGGDPVILGSGRHRWVGDVE